MKRYVGSRIAGEACVTVDGQPLDPRLGLRRHSPDGFEWGYSGSGPAQLALALLADHLGETTKALAYYQDFKFAVVARFKRAGWNLTSVEIERFIETVRPVQAQTSTKQESMEGWT